MPAINFFQKNSEHFIRLNFRMRSRRKKRRTKWKLKNNITNSQRGEELNVNSGVRTEKKRTTRKKSNESYHRKQKRTFNILSLNRLIPIIEYWSAICVWESLSLSSDLHCFHISIFIPFSFCSPIHSLAHAKKKQRINQTFVFWCGRAWIDSNAI